MFFSRFIALIFEFWHNYPSKVMPPACRHYPTCSMYGAEAFRRYGLWKGARLTLGRWIRCSPWGTQGYDPVP